MSPGDYSVKQMGGVVLKQGTIMYSSIIFHIWYKKYILYFKYEML
jgi:hypothetical protein